MDKVKTMLGSVRFWFTLIFVVAYFLGKEQLLMDSIAKALEMFTAIGIVIRSSDKLFDSIK